MPHCQERLTRSRENSVTLFVYFGPHRHPLHEPLPMPVIDVVVYQTQLLKSREARQIHLAALGIYY